MSETDSFIDEVSEEVRKDRLFALFRRYGWIAIALIILLVGGASWNEWQKAQNRSTAQSTGDALLAAIQVEDPVERTNLLEEISGALDDDAQSQVIINFLKANVQTDAGDTAAAVAFYDRVANDDAFPQLYRDIALFKRLLLNAESASAADRRAAFGDLAVAGRPLRLLAEEQLALIHLEEGDKDAAIAGLQAIISDQEATPNLRNRAAQLIVSLGGVPETEQG